MKGLSSAQIADLNREIGGGIFFEAIIVTRDMTSDPQVKDYFAHFGRTFSFGGNLYDPLPMEWEGMQASSQMPIPQENIVLYEVGGIVADYLHDPDVHIAGNDIQKQILHCSTLGVFSIYDWDLLQIQVVRESEGASSATIFAGLNLRFGDRVPKQTIESSEFPGVRADVIRSGTG